MSTEIVDLSRLRLWMGRYSFLIWRQVRANAPYVLLHLQ